MITNVSKKQARLLAKKANIILAGRIIRLKAIPKCLRIYGIEKTLGVEKISDILDDLDKNHLLSINIDPVKMDDGSIDCFLYFLVIDQKTKKGRSLKELGQISLEKLLGNNGLQ